MKEDNVSRIEMSQKKSTITNIFHQAVIAILFNPFFDKETLATRSCREFPKARTVTPMIVLGMYNEMPKRSRISTSLSAIASSHVAAMANLKKFEEG